VPLKRLKEEYLEQDGVRFLMEDAAGSTVSCRVSHEALRAHADRMRFSGTDGAVFEAYRELIEGFSCEICRTYLQVVPDRETPRLLTCDCGAVNLNLLDRT